MYTIRLPPFPVMAAPAEPSPLYRPRDPQASELWRLLDRHFTDFPAGLRRAFSGQVRLLAAGRRAQRDRLSQVRRPARGLRPRPLPDCQHEMFVAFSCKQRCTCPSCHQKRALLTALHVAEEVCSPVAHRQVVFTIPKRLRLHTRFDRSLLGKLSAAAWTCVRDEVRRLLGRDDVLPGMVAAIQTHGELLLRLVLQQVPRRPQKAAS